MAERQRLRGRATHNVDDGLEQLRLAASRAARGSLADLCQELEDAMASAGHYRDDVALLALRRSA